MIRNVRVIENVVMDIVVTLIAHVKMNVVNQMDAVIQTAVIMTVLMIVVNRIVVVTLIGIVDIRGAVL